MSETPNPERRSDGAVWCFSIGAALGAVCYFLGIGTVMTMAFTGGDPGAVLGGVIGAIFIGIAGVVAAVLMLVGVIWMLARVIADSREEAAKERYSREVQR